MKKFKIPIIRPRNPFLPSPDEVAIFLGLPSSPRKKIKLLHKYLKIRTPLPSDRSLDNISKKGVRWNTIRGFLWAILRIARSKIKLSELRHRYHLYSKEKVHYADLSYHWSAVIDGFMLGYKISGVEKDESIDRLICFIESRCQDYLPLFKYLINAPVLTEQNKYEIGYEYFQLAIKSTLLTQDEKITILEIIKNQPEAKISSLDKPLKKIYLLFHYDFWLSLMAVIDNATIILWKKEIPEKEAQEKESSICPDGLLGIMYAFIFCVVDYYLYHHLICYQSLKASQQNRFD